MSRPLRIVVGALVALLVLAGVGATLVGLGVLPSPFGKPPPPTTSDGRRVRRFFLEYVGPKATRISIDGKVVGALEIDADGNVSGQALYALPVYARGMIGCDLPIEREPTVDVALARYVQTFLVARGATGGRIVEPGQSAELLPPPPATPPR